MNITEFKKQITNIHNRSNNNFKPHKFVLILAIVTLIKNKELTENKIYYSEKLKQIFKQLFARYQQSNDWNRPYAPFYYLKTSDFWFLHYHDSVDPNNVARMSSDKDLVNTVNYATFDNEIWDSLQFSNNIKDIELYIIEILENKKEMISNLTIRKSIDPPNPFVNYLNTLHSLNASSENSLAEFQALNPNFNTIFVEHPLVNDIVKKMKQGKNIILTGHAGDGKSTIALSVYKKIKKLDYDLPLEKHLDSIIKFEIDGNKYGIIKDMSEFSLEQRVQLLKKILLEVNCSWLVVSNTGTFLDSFKKYNEEDSIAIESQILQQIDKVESKLAFCDTIFTIYNLSKYNNLKLGINIFARMINGGRWEKCQNQSCQMTCPIFKNVELMRNNWETLKQRLCYLYSRIFEYDKRLTLRQLTAHFAYIITSGLSYQEIIKIAEKPLPRSITSFLFFNRFFGHDGEKDIDSANCLKAVKTVRRQNFGLVSSAQIERDLWLNNKKSPYYFNTSNLDDIFVALHKEGCGNADDISNETNYNEKRRNARTQFKRVLYFLDKKIDKIFLSHYLNSPMLIDYKQKLENNSKINFKKSLRSKTLHVLREHFAGCRLPEQAPNEYKSLYITLNKGIRGGRNSAQIVLAEIPARDLQLSMEPKISLNVVHKRIKKKISLILDLPFLDYVFRRNNGDVGESLDAYYLDRLERFKSELLEEYKRDDNMLELIRLDNSYNFDNIMMNFSNSILEVQ